MTACRGCGATALSTFVDLGMSPLSNAYPSRDSVERGERFFPLHARVCDRCLLVQLGVFARPDEIFSDYAYFSSYSESWLRHSQAFTEEAIARLNLDGRSFVVEVASNDGYLLQYFIGRGIRALGIDPAKNVAKAARERGVPTDVAFFGRETAAQVRERCGAADLIVANNVLAHVPDLHDFVAGFAALLSPQGRCSVEFPHVLDLIERTEFDTIYHEHFSYFSLHALEPVLHANGLRVVDVERLKTHGGSLRVWMARASAEAQEAARVGALREEEAASGLHELRTYTAFPRKVQRTKREVLRFLLDAQEQGKSVAAYGAAAKGNTLLNYCGIKPDSVPFVVDRNVEKQGRLLPGTGIPIFAPEKIFEERPDYVLILPWNIADEIVEQMSAIRSWGGAFVTAVPEIRILT